MVKTIRCTLLLRLSKEICQRRKNLLALRKVWVNCAEGVDQPFVCGIVHQAVGCAGPLQGAGKVYCILVEHIISAGYQEGRRKIVPGTSTAPGPDRVQTHPSSNRGRTGTWAW